MTNLKIESYFQENKNWIKELNFLRKLVLDCGLIEDFKWRNPCYTHNSKNVVIIHGFKEYCALLFFKGALLNDSEGLLIQQTENVQSARQMRFESHHQIEELQTTIKAYIFEAIEIEKAGLKVNLKQNEDFEMPIELEQKLESSLNFRQAFEALTPGRQKAYKLHISGAKTAKSRLDRLEKCTPKIMTGFGFNDCICGLSKRKPNCDGSHKILKS